MLLLGPFAVVATVVAVAAIAKLVDPRSAAAPMASLRLPSSARAVRAMAVVELAAGLAALTFGGRLAAVAVAALFAAFTVVAVILVRRPGASSCGCFGALSAQVGTIHVAIDAMAALVAAAAVVRPVPGLVADHGRLPAAGVPHAVLVVVGAVLLVAVLGPLAETRAAARAPAVRTFGPTGSPA